LGQEAKWVTKRLGQLAQDNNDAAAGCATPNKNVSVDVDLSEGRGAPTANSRAGAERKKRKLRSSLKHAGGKTLVDSANHGDSSKSDSSTTVDLTVCSAVVDLTEARTSSSGLASHEDGDYDEDEYSVPLRERLQRRMLLKS
jgi:hypothetical protein